MPSFPKASATHLLVTAAAIRGTMYSRPPVSSNMMTTRETVILVTPPEGSQSQERVNGDQLTDRHAFWSVVFMWTRCSTASTHPDRRRLPPWRTVRASHSRRRAGTSSWRWSSRGGGTPSAPRRSRRSVLRWRRPPCWGWRDLMGSAGDNYKEFRSLSRSEWRTRS